MKWSVKLFISGKVVEDIVFAPNMDSARETSKRRNASEAKVISVNAKIYPNHSTHNRFEGACNLVQVE